MQNPYAPPQAPLEEAIQEKSSVWWKIFFWFTAILMTISFAVVPFMEGLAVWDYVDLGVSLVALVGLFGFVFYKRLGQKRFWQVFFWLALLESTLMLLALPMARIPTYGVVTSLDAWFAFEAAFAGALLYALYQYAYRRPQIWGDASTKVLGTME